MNEPTKEYVLQQINDAKNSGNPPLMGLAFAVEKIVEELIEINKKQIEPMLSKESVVPFPKGKTAEEIERRNKETNSTVDIEFWNKHQDHPAKVLIDKILGDRSKEIISTIDKYWWYEVAKVCLEKCKRDEFDKIEDIILESGNDPKATLSAIVDHIVRTKKYG